MEKKPGRPPKPGKPKKTRSVYCDDDQHEYLCWWLKHKGDVPPVEKWKGKG